MCILRCRKLFKLEISLLEKCTYPNRDFLYVGSKQLNALHPKQTLFKAKRDFLYTVVLIIFVVMPKVLLYLYIYYT